MLFYAALIPNQEEETKILLGLPPDRIGHGTFLNSATTGSEELVPLVRQNHIPIGKETRNHLVISELKNVMLTADSITLICLWWHLYFLHICGSGQQLMSEMKTKLNHNP